MKSRLITAAVTTIAILCLPSPAYADGGAPLLLLINLPLFTIGQIWIVGIEWYLLRNQIKVAKQTLLCWVVAANAMSALICAFGLPALWAALTLLVSAVAGDSELGTTLLALGTWFTVDTIPRKSIALIAAGLGFVTTYFPTVWIELTLLRRLLVKHDQQVSNLTRSVVTANLASYAGLMVLAALGLTFGW